MKKIIFQDSFLVLGIMCHQGCGARIQHDLGDLSELKRKHLLPNDAQLTIDAEPQALGVHRLILMIEIGDRSFSLQEHAKTELSKQFKERIEAAGHEVIDDDGGEQETYNTINWVNIFINLVAIATIIVLSVVFPPSLPLIIGLTVFSFLTTAFTARSYFIHFFRNLRHRNLFNMPTSITLAWVLSLTHSLYHVVSMPFMIGFAMTFMNFIMPVMLVTIINVMDEIKRLVLNKSKKIHLKGMKSLFPDMANEYLCYPLSEEEEVVFEDAVKRGKTVTIQDMLQDDKRMACNKNALQKGMIIQVKRGDCFPVDGIIVQGRTRIDASILNGESQQLKQVCDSVPAGAINLGQDVVIRATENCYDSTVNQLLFCSNRAQEYGLIKLLSDPKTMARDELKKRLNNKSSYVLCDSKVYYFDKNLKKTELHTTNFKQLAAIFPKTAHILDSASKEALIKITSLTGHTRDKLVGMDTDQRFIYLYLGLIIVGVVVSILIPYALGLFTVPLMLQTITGILFVICPCTIAIAHQLPILFNMSRLNDKDIIMRNGDLTERFDDIHTVVFDKTGTLTTGASSVNERASEGLSPALWNRIYLLEEKHGLDHPLAKAICGYCKTNNYHQTRFTEVTDYEPDERHRGLSASVQGKRLHLGNAQYLKDSVGVNVPEHSESIQFHLAQGYTPVYVAEYDSVQKKSVYQGVIFIEHSIKPEVLEGLFRLKRGKINLIMLTGDHRDAAIGFNQQNGAIFDAQHIHAEQTFQDKEQFLNELMSNEHLDSRGVWFVGDGLNDAPCARMVTDKGGVSCAMTSTDKAAFFTDISLNGTLDYLFEYKTLNHTLKKNITQNQWLLVYGAVVFLAFIITLPIVGIGMSPLIPMIVMVSTTFFTLFNSYRVKLAVDNSLDKKPSWLKQCLASDMSLGFLVVGSALLILSVLIATVASGHIALPVFVFTAGATAAISSSCFLVAATMFGGLILLGMTYFCVYRDTNKKDVITDVIESHVSRPNGAESLCHDNQDECYYPSLHFGLLNRGGKRDVLDKPQQSTEVVNERCSEGITYNI